MNSSNWHSPQSRQCRLLLMIASMDGGGSERQTLLLLQHLAREKFAPELLVLRRGGALYSQIPADVPIHCLEEQVPRPFINWPGRIHRAQVRALRQILQRQAIDVVYDRTFHMTLIAGPAACEPAVPRVSTIVSPPSRAVPLNAGKFVELKRRRLRAAYRQAARVIAVSRPTARDARRYYGLSPQQITVVPNPVDRVALEQAIQQTAVPRDQRYTLVCVGRMTEEKGHACLLQSLATLRERYPDFERPRLWLLGDGPLRSSLENLSHQLGIADQVQFLGHIVNPAPWIAAADALCMPSRFEGFPNVMLEAMAIGTPVIASDIEVVRSLGALPQCPLLRGRDFVATFPCDDPVTLAKKIRRLRLNPTATRSRLLAARELSLQTHATGTIVPRIESIILEAFQNRLAAQRS